MLRICDLKAGYDKHTVLRGVSFELEKGHILGFLGRNGCGKTTLFKCINGFLKPFSGSIFLDGKDASEKRTIKVAWGTALNTDATTHNFTYSLGKTAASEKVADNTDKRLFETVFRKHLSWQQGYFRPDPAGTGPDGGFCAPGHVGGILYPRSRDDPPWFQLPHQGLGKAGDQL